MKQLQKDNVVAFNHHGINIFVTETERFWEADLRESSGRKFDVGFVRLPKRPGATFDDFLMEAAQVINKMVEKKPPVSTLVHPGTDRYETPAGNHHHEKKRGKTKNLPTSNPRLEEAFRELAAQQRAARR